MQLFNYEPTEDFIKISLKQSKYFILLFMCNFFTVKKLNSMMSRVYVIEIISNSG